MGKSLVIGFNEAERFAIWMHFSQNVVTNSAKEQDEYNDLWDSFQLDAISERVEAAQEAGKVSIDKKDFDSELRDIELTKEEIGYFIAFCGRAMKGVLSRDIRPLRIRVAEARDKAGLKAVPAEQG